MDHPNIAKVLDAGATSTGRPYFVMELIQGVRITDYCDQRCLSTVERLSLFTQVCQAVQHAHQKGTIHRDIKPSNILVNMHDGVPVPKVIDFGIAKATEQALTDKTVLTAFGQFMGTPAYMSPEHRAGRGPHKPTGFRPRKQWRFGLAHAPACTWSCPWTSRPRRAPVIRKLPQTCWRLVEMGNGTAPKHIRSR